MSRAPAGIQMQVLVAGVATNSVHWATPWLRECAALPSTKWTKTLDSPKRMVRVAANSPALVQQTAAGTSLQFAPTSALPGVTLFLKGVPAFQLPLGFYQPCKIASDSTKQALVTQKLRLAGSQPVAFEHLHRGWKGQCCAMVSPRFCCAPRSSHERGLEHFT
jgi:hypothetical protein